MHVQWKLPVPSTYVTWQFLHDLHVSLALQCIFEPLIPLQTHLKSTKNNVTVNAAASTLLQASEAVSSTQQSLVSSPAQEQPAAAQTQELSSRDTMDRPGPSHVRTYNLHVHDCLMYRSELKLILIAFNFIHFAGTYSKRWTGHVLKWKSWKVAYFYLSVYCSQTIPTILK